MQDRIGAAGTFHAKLNSGLTQSNFAERVASGWDYQWEIAHGEGLSLADLAVRIG